MNKNYPLLSILAVLVFVTTVYGTQSAAKAAPEAAVYEGILGKLVNDPEVVDFIASNGCSSVGQFRLCNDAGMALWTDRNQRIEMVYLYLTRNDDFEAYRGALPLGLSASDTRATVQDKLGQPRVPYAPQAGWSPGLPDASGTPDHVHAWAIYERFGVSVIYNSPSATDSSATIYAIVVNK